MGLKQYLDTVEEGQLGTVHDVKRLLQDIDDLLEDSDLRRLKYFNSAYLEITRAVERELARSRFKKPSFLHSFDTRFVWYYLVPLRNYLAGKPVVPAWQIVFDTCYDKSVKPAHVLALGVNAHVNNDIPQVLADVQAQKSNTKDYFVVNRIIDRSVSKILSDLRVSNWFQRQYYRIGMYILIRLWRRSSWRKASRLKKMQTDHKQVEKQAKTISQGTSHFPI
jgi:hypothetical protein